MQKVATGNGISYTETLAYYANGQIKTKAEKLTDNGTDVQDITVTYSYDKLGRLSKVANTDPLLGNETVSYTYDKVGNRTAQTANGTTTSYTYNANDQLLTAGVVTYTYDANGNTLTKTENGNTTTYNYDKQNKLISVENNGLTTEFSYNPNGLRIGKKTATDEIHYLIDELSGFGDVIAEYENGTKAKTYTLGNRRISQSQNGQTHYYGTDNQGSVKFLSNNSGLTDEYAYDSFGALKNQTGTTDNDFKYTGEQFDSTLNMYNLRARYYAPEIGRFYGLDTYQGQQSDPESLHKYLYTSNDPINMVDPTGQFGILSVSINLNISSTIRGLGAIGTRQVFTKVLTQLAKYYGPRAVKREVKKCMNRKTRKNCRLVIPILVIGHDAPTAADHAWDASIGNGTNLVPAGFWFTYKYRSNSSARRFYNRTSQCSSDARSDYSMSWNGDKGDCDEYPFHKTTRGGKDNYPTYVSLRLINKNDNQKAGSHFGGLVKSAGLNKGKGHEFLVVPINEAPFKTIGLPLKKYK